MEDEREGQCKMLHLRNREVRLCRARVTGTNPLCYTCFSAADDVTRERAENWPPLKKGRETRLIHNVDDDYFGILSIGEHNEYFHDEVPQRKKVPVAKVDPKFDLRTAVFVDQPPSFPFHVVEVKVPPPSPKWLLGDQAHRGLWSIYVIRLDDGSFYVGQTRKPAVERVAEHSAGTGAAICRERGVDKLLFRTRTKTRVAAQELEAYTVQVLRSLGLRVAAGSDPDA